MPRIANNPPRFGFGKAVTKSGDKNPRLSVVSPPLIVGVVMGELVQLYGCGVLGSGGGEFIPQREK